MDGRATPTGATTDASLLEDFQDAVESLLSSGLTCELLDQLDEAVFVYRECVKKLRALYFKISDVTAGRELTPILTDGANFIQFLYDMVRVRTDALDDFRQNAPGTMHDRTLRDLHVVPRNLGSIHISNEDELFISKKVKKKKRVKWRRRRRDSKTFTSLVAQTPKKTRQFRRIEFPTNGSLNEELVFLNVDVFSIEDGMPRISELDASVRLFSFQEVAKNPKPNVIKHFLSVGSWLTPLVPTVTPILWNSNIYVFPDYSSFSQASFKAIMLYEYEPIKALKMELEKLGDFHPFKGQLIRRPSSWDKGRATTDRDTYMGMLLERRPRSNPFCEITKASMLGKLMCALNLLLPKREFYVDNGELFLKNRPCDKKHIIDIVYKSLCKDVDIEKSILENMNDAFDTLQYWLLDLPFRATVVDFIQSEKDGFSNRGVGTARTLNNAARFSFRLNKKLLA